MLIAKVIIVLVLCVLISLFVILQPTKDGNGLSGLNGASTPLMGNTKKRGIEPVLFRFTVVFGILLFVALLVF